MVMSEEEIIQGVKQQDRRAQNELFKRYGPVMLSICRRYFRQLTVAEDILVHSFFRIMTKIEAYEGKGSFEGWMKRIVINECLMEIRKTKNQFLTVA